MADIKFEGNNFFLSKEDVSEELYEALMNCTGPGHADQSVQYVRDVWDIEGDEKDCRRYLRKFGVWDNDDLMDHDANLSRLVWIVACDLSENGVSCL